MSSFPPSSDLRTPLFPCRRPPRLFLPATPARRAAAHLFRALAANTTLTDLEIDDCDIGRAEAAPALAEALKRCTSLAKLSFFARDMDALGAPAVLRGLEAAATRQLRELVLSSARVNPGGGDACAPGAPRLPQQSSAPPARHRQPREDEPCSQPALLSSFRGARFSAGCEALARALRQPCCSLEFLELAFHITITDAGGAQAELTDPQQQGSAAQSSSFLRSLR